MQRPRPLTFANFVAVPETRPALLAVERVAECLFSGRQQRADNPLFLHGQAGTGKTHLVSALAERLARQAPRLVFTVIGARELVPAERLPKMSAASEAEADSGELDQGDVFIVEDVQHLPADSAGELVRLFDRFQPRQVQMVFTAAVGPRHLNLPARLTSRLAAGLVVGLEPLQAPSRLAFLQDKAQRRQLALKYDVLAWLAQHLTGGRQLEGALHRLELLSRNHGRLLDVPAVAEHFQEQAHTARPTVERIAAKVGAYFHVDLRQLRSEHRGRNVLLPRQIGMYLARQLTALSLEQIGSYFGGRDHSTVLHACRKIEQGLSRDASLSGTVRHIYLELA